MFELLEEMGLMGYLWTFLVALAPIGIWRAKSRITALEKQIEQLSTQVRILTGVPPAPAKNPMELSPVAATKSAAAEINIPQKKEPVEPARVDIPVAPVAIQKERVEHNPPSYKPSQPSEPLIPEWLMQWFSGGRLFVTVGMLLLFIGAAMLFKYIAHQIEIPIEARFIAVAAAALVMMFIGYRVMGKRRDYGLYLQGGGLGLLFLTVFAAFKFYSLLPSGLAFTLLVAIGGVTILLSLAYNAMPLAVLAVTGGFAAPLLTSTGQGSYIALFSYYLLINLVLFAISWFKQWRLLNLIGFFFTFAIGLLWGGKYYIPEYYPIVQCFLITYFLLYTTMGVLFARGERLNLWNSVDSSSIFGVPLVGFGMQMALVKDLPDGIAISALALSAFYGLLSGLLRATKLEPWQLLGRIFTIHALVFLSVSIPFGLSAEQTGGLWAAEGAAFIWMYVRTGRKLFRLGAALLIFGSAGAMLFAQWGEGKVFFNGFYLSALIICVSAFISAWQMQSKLAARDGVDSILIGLFSHLGVFIWFLLNLAEMRHWLVPERIPVELQWQIILMPWLSFISISSLMLVITSRYTKLSVLTWPAHVLPLVFCAAIILHSAYQVEFAPSALGGWWGWGIALGCYYGWLRLQRQVNGWYHCFGALFLAALLALEAAYHLYNYHPYEVYRMSAWLLVLSAALITIHYGLSSITRFFAGYEKDYRNAALIFWLGNALLLFLICTDRAIPWLQDYIPVANLIDFSLILGMAVLWHTRSFLQPMWEKGTVQAFNAALLFMLFNSLLLKLLGYVLKLPYLEDEMFRSVEVQTSLTIAWTILAMGLMLFASRRSVRLVWFTGAGLLAVVIAKLFLVDLAGVGTLSRIVSFLGVGVLTMLLGYFSPIPPKQAQS